MPGRKTRKPDGPAPLVNLYASPEFLIRRAHQIATAVFNETCADLDLTPAQYSALFALRERGGVGQNELGRLVSLDRATTSMIVKTLRERGLITASADAHDRRKTLLDLTDEGRLLLASAERCNVQSSQELLSVFDPAQAATFLELLNKLTNSPASKGQRSKPLAR